jgi:RNA polymerase sigma-70 factor (ECF subfamily)
MDTTRFSLLLRIKDLNDSDAWAEFDAIYRPILRRYALARGLQAADVDDVIQHCMTAVHAHIPTFQYDKSRGRFKAWLRTIVNNRVKNLLRDRRERIGDSGDFRQMESREPPVEDAFESLWMEEHLRHALRLLRAEVDAISFTAFEEYAVRERPVEDVCAELGLTPNALYKIKWRLTRRLGETMRDLQGDED